MNRFTPLRLDAFLLMLFGGLSVFEPTLIGLALVAGVWMLAGVIVLAADSIRAAVLQGTAAAGRR